MSSILIKNANIVNEGQVFESDLLIEDGRITKIAPSITSKPVSKIIDANGNFLVPGLIDDQVHFREPGLTHKAEIYTESKAAVAGGITSFMEMPNTVPNTVTIDLLEDKYQIASQKSLANYSFFMGANNENIEEVLKVNKKNVCGIKVFMGSSTGNMLVDEPKTLENIFSKSELLIATHCEDEQTIKDNLQIFKDKYGDDIPVIYHPEIRNAEACYKSSSLAVSLAKKFGTRLHILHISTAKELELFEDKPLNEKKITAEACVHHLWFDKNDYNKKGTFIKWNPAVKNPSDKSALLAALHTNKIDVIATDHAPHTLEEKQNNYMNAPSGGPLVQHSLVAMLEYHRSKKLDITTIIEKMCHNPAKLFEIKDRGFIREGYHADLVIVDLNDPWIVKKDTILSKCGWSPFEGQLFHSRISHTIVSGHLAYENGSFNENVKGQRLLFDRR